MNDKRLNRLVGILWGLALLTVPVTSFKYYPKFFGSAATQPLSFIPLLVLMPFLALMVWRSGKVRLPVQTFVLLVFLLVVAMSNVFGGLNPPIEVRGFDHWSRSIRAWVSLGIGLAFFWVAYFVSDSEQRLKNSMKWLYAGLAATIILGSIQAIAEFTPYIDIDLIRKFQLSFSVRSLGPNRIAGFAFEPAWMADQLIIFSIPWLFASFLTGYRPIKSRWYEILLVLGSMVILYFSYSRNGYLVLAATLTITGLIVKWPLLAKVFTKFNISTRSGALGIGVLVVAGVGVGGYMVLGVLDIGSLRDLLNYLVRIRAGERLAAATAGFSLFGENPWFGVGFGTSGLYLFDHYPDWAFGRVSVLSRFLTYKFIVVPTSRNIYIRLLSETGIFGLWFFIAFFLSILGTIRGLLWSNRPARHYLGVVGLFSIIAIIIRNFTQDSFTFPVMWLMLGMVLGYDAHLSKEGER